jgi:hypothetical protein
MESSAFNDWKASGSLLWIYGKRMVISNLSCRLANAFACIAGSGKSVLRFVTPPLPRSFRKTIEHPLVHQSSRISNASLPPGQHTWPTSSSISKIPENRMPMPYFVLSSSSSAIDPILSVTFSLPVIKPTVRAEPGAVRLR